MLTLLTIRIIDVAIKNLEDFNTYLYLEKKDACEKNNGGLARPSKEGVA